jgi:hypothetical protein
MADPTFEDDPAEYLKRRIEQQQREIQRLHGEKAQSNQLNAVAQQEDGFRRTHSDYDNAFKDFVDSEIQEFQLSGLERTHAQQIRQATRSSRCCARN